LIKPDLSVKIGKLTLRNPVMTASGTAGYGEELSGFYDLSGLGAIVLKGISLAPWQGNPAPRITETHCGMINSIGLQNVGLRVFIKEKLPFVRKFDVPVIANILGNTVSEYVKIAKSLDDEGVNGIELNVSCPNVKKGGISFGTDLKTCSALVRKVRARVNRAVLIVKLSPMAPDIAEFARQAEAEGADAISLINTVPAMAIDINTRRPLLRNGAGGLSGPAIKPIALRMVRRAYRAVGIPIIGMGGISSGEDAVEFLLAGATAVAVGTAIFSNPMAPLDVASGIARYMERQGVSTVSELTGGLLEDL
jgi:dihydroorotate dehydrogenase (NAD+) catalytic subunit